MHNFIITLNNPSMQIGLGFKTYESAYAAREKAKERVKQGGMVNITDDFGREFETDSRNVSAFLIESHQKAKEMINEQQIDNAKAAEAFSKRRNEDVELIRLFPSQNIVGRTN